MNHKSGLVIVQVMEALKLLTVNIYYIHVTVTDTEKRLAKQAYNVRQKLRHFTVKFSVGCLGNISLLSPQTMLAFFFLRLHRPQHPHNIELGGNSFSKSLVHCSLELLLYIIPFCNIQFRLLFCHTLSFLNCKGCIVKFFL